MCFDWIVKKAKVIANLLGKKKTHKKQYDFIGLKKTYEKQHDFIGLKKTYEK